MSVFRKEGIVKGQIRDLQYYHMNGQPIVIVRQYDGKYWDPIYVGDNICKGMEFCPFVTWDDLDSRPL